MMLSLTLAEDSDATPDRRVSTCPLTARIDAEVSLGYRSRAEHDQDSLACDDMSGGAGVQRLGSRQGSDAACRLCNYRATDRPDDRWRWPHSRYTKQGRSTSDQLRASGGARAFSTATDRTWRSSRFIG